MATIQDLRKAHPEYKDLSDKELADGIYQKYYSDIPRDEFYKKVSFTPPPEKPFMQEAGETVMEGLPGRFGVRTAQGAMGVPGFPIDAMVAGGNFMRRQFDLPEVQSVPGTPAHDWGSEGWRKYFEKFVGKPNIPDATSEAERFTDKLGTFVGGGLPFGPAGLLPSVTATAGSEVGRATDQAGLTGGYGEFGGALLGGMAPGLVRGQTTSGVIANAPSIAALQAAKRAAYNASEAEGAIFTPQAMDRLNTQVKQHAADFGYDPANQPGIAPVLRRLEDASTQNVTLKGLDTIRKVAGHAAGDFTKPSQQTLASKIKEFIDALPDNLQHGDVLAGNAQKAAELINKGRYLNQRISLAKTLDEAMSNAKLQAGSSGVGGNLENAMRQKIKQILTSPKRRAGFSQGEQKLMEQIVTGNEGIARNALRHVGGFAPSKGFLPATLNTVAGVGSVASGGALTPIALATMGGLEGAKALGEALTRRDIARLNAMVRMGRQPAQSLAQKINAAWLEAQRRAALARQSTLPVIPGVVEQDR